MKYAASEQAEEREHLRMELETFLRQKYGLGEGFEAVAEDWDARGVAMMVFRVGAGEIMRALGAMA